MQEILQQVVSVLRGMWKYRWLGLAAGWVVGLVSLVVVFKIPDQYEASARIYVDTQSILKPLMAGLTIQPNIEQQVGMLSRTLISRPNIEKLIRMADMDLKSTSKAEQEQLIDRLVKDIKIQNAGRDNLYSLVYRDADREKAKRLIQSLVSVFVESSLGASRKDSDSAKTFLSDQIKQYEAKLEEAETRLKEFKMRNIDRASPDGKDAASIVSEAAAQLRQAQLQLREAENARDAVKAQIASEKSQAAAAAAPAGSAAAAEIPVSTPEIDERIAAQKRNLDMLLQRFTEAHPDVVITRKLIRDLEEQRKKEAAELRKQAAAAPGGAAPMGGGMSMAQELTRMLAESEAQVASLKARVAEYAGRLGAAREGLKTAPQIEAEAAQLNRDYEVYRKNYQDLVARRQSAIMSGELDAASGVADFRLIDPPRVTPQPVAPNRLLLMPLALVAALAAALLAAFAASQIRPVFDQGDQLRASTGLPLLGVVSLVLSDTDRRRRRRGNLRFAGASGALVSLFALGMIAMALLAQRAAG
ncbi:MAG: XrtA system polysaccharide chain length determinant [Rubrivivax sp.]